MRRSRPTQSTMRHVARVSIRERLREDLANWRRHLRESIIDINDGIVSAAGISEGIASAGGSGNALLVAGVATILAGGFAAGGARYTEVRTEWEMNRALLEAERQSIEADPAGELEELAGLYERKGLRPDLARQVAEAMHDRDPVAAHADVELSLQELGPRSGAEVEGAIAALAFGAGAALPLAAMQSVPHDSRMAWTFVLVLIALGLTGALAARITGLPTWRLVRRNILLGTATMLSSLLLGLLLGL